MIAPEKRGVEPSGTGAACVKGAWIVWLGPGIECGMHQQLFPSVTHGLRILENV